jgi:2-hydroxymuconate-semialdehyde hydrolase
VIPPQRRRARVSGGELAYVDVGDGPPVLLLHGFPTSSYLWRREIWLLAQRLRVIAPDLLGYGESEKPDGVDLSEPAHARYVGELLKQLGVASAAVAGHDIGGGIAQLLALDGDVAVEALVLLDTVCFDAWPIEGVRMLQGAVAEQQTPEFVEGVVRMSLDVGMRHHDRLSEDDVQAYLEPWLAEPAAFFRAVGGIEGQGLAGRDQELAELDAPALILWGEDDPFLPVELAERLGDLLPGSTTGLLPGCSHFVTEDAPQTVGPLIYEYLRSRYLHDVHEHEPSGPVPVFLERPPDRLLGLDVDPAETGQP